MVATAMRSGLSVLGSGMRPALGMARVSADFVVGGALHNARTAAAFVSDQRQLRQGLAPSSPKSGGPFTRLGRAECFELLGTCTVGRLAYIARSGAPDIVPVNYAMWGDTVVVRSGPGPKLQAAERREMVAFEVDELEHALRGGWSVVVVGRARRMSAAERWPVPAHALPETWAPGQRFALIRISPLRIEGRCLSSP